MQVAAALAEQPLMPLTRAKLAIPFVGCWAVDSCRVLGFSGVLLYLYGFGADFCKVVLLKPCSFGDFTCLSTITPPRI